MTVIGAWRKRVTLLTNFRSPPVNGHSRYGHPTTRFAPKATFTIASPQLQPVGLVLLIGCPFFGGRYSFPDHRSVFRQIGSRLLPCLAGE